jgi:hypothetical protein
MAIGPPSIFAVPVIRFPLRVPSWEVEIGLPACSCLIENKTRSSLSKKSLDSNLVPSSIRTVQPSLPSFSVTSIETFFFMGPMESVHSQSPRRACLFSWDGPVGGCCAASGDATRRRKTMENTAFGTIMHACLLRNECDQSRTGPTSKVTHNDETPPGTLKAPK